MSLRLLFPPGFFFLVLLLTFVSGTPASAKYERSLETYLAPDVTLINQDRQPVQLRQLLNSGKPVLLDFIYATCTTICPVLSAGFSNLQKKLGDEAAGVQFVSISIDPEHDRPEIMKTYLTRYRARPGWDYLTGTRTDIDQVMHAFDAYVSDKMSHYPLTLIKVPGKDQWLRIYGLTSTRDLLREYRQLYPGKAK
ncbi:SCO family protein [Geothermobacter hydrogeniphilus]|uniref:SCO family protein n=1 Tax=Geothermobacter hydrogeniphilus TaxID=1969733 RepID=A0A1X0XQ01_9BACT|nr:SCO family protein [Geothermobacter hydrogeniphilus]ORJ54966.1 SCO family protein [Geothermobacter hydrogeniphilus]